MFKSSVIVSICLTYRFRVTVSALLSLVGLAHQLLLPLAAFKCDMFEQIKFNLIFKKILCLYLLYSCEIKYTQ